MYILHEKRKITQGEKTFYVQWSRTYPPYPTLSKAVPFSTHFKGLQIFTDRLQPNHNQC